MPVDLYKISADGGKTWTLQCLTEEEVQEHINKGYLVREYYYTGMK